MVVAVSARAEAGAADRGRGIEMRAKEMHPLCCINIDCPGLSGGGVAGGGGGGGSSSSAGGRSPTQPDHYWDRCVREPSGNAAGCPGSEVRVAGILYKWTNYGRGWRSRWFSLSGGVLYYSKTRVMPEGIGGGEGKGGATAAAAAEDVRLIGNRSSAAAANGVYRVDNGHGGGSGGRRKPRKPDGVVQLKVSSFRESRSDDRRFYIFSATKTLHLKTDSKKDRADWIEALKLARNSFPPRSRSLTDRLPFVPNEVSFSTAKLRNRLLQEGLGEVLIKDCEHIILSEFMHLKLVYEENLGLLALRQCEESADVRTTGLPEEQMLIKDGFSGSGHGKFSEYSTTESSDDIGKQDIDELSEEDDEAFYFDSRDTFSESGIEDVDKADSASNKMISTRHKFPHVERRMRLPDPVEKEKGVSLWSMIKDNVGKDLTRVCLPVYFNEPLSSLQKCFEDLEYSYLLDRAYKFGKMGNSIMRTLYVAAFAVSGYASTVGRACKPFNPLLGETYEADFPEKGVRFFSEKVSHHPMVIACHCEGRGWKFWGDSNLKSKFWGRSIQVDPVGILTLEFDDGEIFQWSKVTTTIYNLILGKIYCNHHGTMHIQGNRGYSCKLKFKEQTLLDRNPHQVQGFVEDIMGAKVASLTGKWDESLFYVEGDDISKIKSTNLPEAASLLWKKSDPAPNPTRYNLTSFAITLNELTPELQEKLPPTDSRRRPDQRHLENGEYEKANSEKQRLERRQRMSRNLQERGWKPRWFNRDGEDGTFQYIGGYWEAREQKKWDGCLNIFGEISEESNGSSLK